MLPEDTQDVRTANAERFTAEHLSLGDLHEPAEKLHEGSSDLINLMCSNRVKPPSLQPAPLGALAYTTKPLAAAKLADLCQKTQLIFRGG